MKQWICALLALTLLFACPALAQEALPDLSAAGDGIVAAEVVTAPSDAADAVEPEVDAPESTEAAEPDAADATGEAESQEAVETVTVAFEDGFSLELPGDWLHYEVSDEMAQSGVLYCLSDAAGECWLYIQSWITDCGDIEALHTLIDETSQPQTSGVYDFNGTQFVIYDLTDADVSCCAALLNDRVLNFVFTPQSDADFMVSAAQIIGTFTVL